ncbi:hypothetical protein [Niabella beijingensis]|uniref:hypothetical protein n=1 Tax=Niabella beijingensis TaxID=2872700 RepID=UPI001CBBE300|nr:hypothetical protein [Niabella beijingensis]MBZ4188959.1 hypothetical protein [Niabella beijingensis]
MSTISKTRAITKKALVAAAKRGTKKAAAVGMNIDGYNIVAKNGWIVKLYQSGRVERLSKIARYHVSVLFD